MTSSEQVPTFDLLLEQKYEFDLQGYIVLKQHCGEEVAREPDSGQHEVEIDVDANASDEEIGN